MKYLSTICILFLISLLACTEQSQSPNWVEDPEDAKGVPYDLFFLQRSYPSVKPDIEGYLSALESAKSDLLLKSDLPGFDREWTVRGPGNIGGRTNVVTVDPNDNAVIYAGFSAGGLFKTTNGGGDWAPIFDEQSYLAIGAVAIDPTNSNIVYVGTGDPNITGNPFIGDGVYKSEDAGQTWTHMGLSAQRIVSRILIDPTNTDIIYASTMGLPFERNNDRGLYKSIDGGANWEQILFVSNQAGIIDMVMAPNDPQVIYAAGWDRVRNNMESIIDGPGAKIFKTTNGGDDWTQLSGGLPQEDFGRIGLAISQTNPDKVFALYVNLDRDLENVYKTENAGETWEPIISFNGSGLTVNSQPLGGFGWFFGQVRVNPLNDDEIYILGVDLWRSVDGGGFWDLAAPPWGTYEVHADKHDLTFDSEGGMLLATDGGVYKSLDNTQTWFDLEDIPTTQFYRVAYNPHNPTWYYGGAQDNGTTGGASLTMNWPRIFGGDGFQTIFHPTDPDIFYVETQNGGIRYTLNGGAFSLATDGIPNSGEERRNWDMQYIMSPHDPNVLYTGTYRIWRSDIGPIPFWQPISEDLTDGLILHPRYHTITTLDESPLEEGLLYVGTTDGNVWRGDVDNFDWTSISAGLPDRYVTSIKASPTYTDQVFVTHSGYKDNEFLPRVFRSSNRGDSWEDISGDLPNLAINDIYVLPNRQDSVLFVATDGGIYGTIDSGQNWERLGNNLPMIAVFDLEWNPSRDELIAGTYARSILSYPLDSIGFEAMPLDTMDMDTTDMDTTVFVQNLTVHKELTIYPSPAKDQIFIGLEGESIALNSLIRIFDNQGRLVHTKRIQNTTAETINIQVQQLPPGIYTLNFRQLDVLYVGRFVKE